MTLVGRQYAFTQTAGKLPLRIQTPSRWHVYRTGAVGHLLPLAHALSNGHSNVGSAQSTDLRASTVFVTSTANRTFASRARPSIQCPLQGNYHECSTACDQRSHSKWRLTHWPAAINLGPEPLCFRSPVQ